VIYINRGYYKTSKNDYVRKKTKSSHGFVDSNYNSFALLLDYNTEFYKCNTYGNISRECRSNIIISLKQNREEDVLANNREECTKVWKRKK
jgi:hypothetical protein